MSDFSNCAVSGSTFTERKKMSKSLKKIVEETRDKSLPEVEMCDRGISNMLDVPGLCKRAATVHLQIPTCLEINI